MAGSPPQGWEVLADEDDPGLTVVGPRDVEGVRARVEVTLERVAPAPIEAHSVEVMRDLQERYPDALLATCDVWPHPTWGDGRFIQTAYLLDGLAVAHDCYLFVADGVRVIATVHCLLQDLLSLEDQVARIVASLRTVDAT